MVRSGRMTQAAEQVTLPQDLETVTRDTGPQIALQLAETTNLRQKDIAELMGWSEPTISRWIREAREDRERRENEQAARRSRRENAFKTIVLMIFTACAVLVTAALWVIALR